MLCTGIPTSALDHRRRNATRFNSIHEISGSEGVCVCTKTSIAPGNLTDTLGIAGTYQVYLELGKIRYLQGMTDEALEYLVSMISL